MTLARELGFVELDNIVRVGTASSAAKSFVNRRVLGRMRHIDIRDLWLQQEVADAPKALKDGVKHPDQNAQKYL